MQLFKWLEPYCCSCTWLQLERCTRTRSAASIGESTSPLLLTPPFPAAAGVRELESTLCRYRQYLGRADYVRLDGATAQGCKRVLVASSNGVVGSIDAETGDLGKQ